MSCTAYVAFDLDDVLANLREPLMAMLNRRTARSLHWTQWTEYELCEPYGVTLKQIQRWVVDDGVLEEATPEPLARQAIEAARDAGYRIAVVTARGWHPRGTILTEEWLCRHALQVDTLRLVPAFGPKAPALRGLGVVAHYVDDHVAHLHLARGLTEIRRVHLLDRPWNRAETNLPRIQGLDELVSLLAAEGNRGRAPAGVAPIV